MSIPIRLSSPYCTAPATTHAVLAENPLRLIDHVSAHTTIANRETSRISWPLDLKQAVVICSSEHFWPTRFELDMPDQLSDRRTREAYLRVCLVDIGASLCSSNPYPKFAHLNQTELHLMLLSIRSISLPIVPKYMTARLSRHYGWIEVSFLVAELTLPTAVIFSIDRQRLT